MTKLEQIRAAESKLLLQTYERNPILFVGGEGVHLIDEGGAKYLDLLSGIGVNALGYGHPAIERAIVNQSRALIHTSNLFYHEGQAELALRLTERTGMDRAFFSNTGTEAWEGALKLARAHAGLLRSEGKQIGTKFLALEQSFHGRTFGSMSTTYKAKYREPFAPGVPGVEFVRFNDVADLRAKFSNEVCAILVEAIQGEGGIRPLSQEFFAEARKLTDSTGAFLIVDEIQAGMGRTGKWCALSALRNQAGCHDAGEADCRRNSAGSDSMHRGSGARDSCRNAWNDVWRWSAGLCRGDRGDRRDRERGTAVACD